MRTKETPLALTSSTPSSATTSFTSPLTSSWFERADGLVIDATLTAGVGGSLDVTLQRLVSTNPNAWLDWLRYPTVSAGATKCHSHAIDGNGTAIVEVGAGDDTHGNVDIAVDTNVNVIPGNTIRAVMTQNAGTSAAGSISLTITPYTERH